MTPFRQTTTNDSLGVAEVSSATDTKDLPSDQFPFGNPENYVDDDGESLDALFNITADTFCKLRSRSRYLIRFKSLIDARPRDQRNRLIKPFRGKYTWSEIVKDLLHRDPRTVRYLFAEQKSKAQKANEKKKREEKTANKPFTFREQSAYDPGVTRTLAGQRFSNGTGASVVSDFTVPKVVGRLVMINAEALQNVPSPQDRDVIARSIISELQKFLLPTETQPPTEPPTRRKIKSPAGKVHVDELPPDVRAKVLSKINSKPVAAPDSNYDAEIVVGHDGQQDATVQEDPSAGSVSQEPAPEFDPTRLTDSPAASITRPLPGKCERGPAIDGHGQSEREREPETPDAAAKNPFRADMSPAIAELFLQKWASSGRRLPPRLVFTPTGFRFERYRFADLNDVIPEAVAPKMPRGKVLMPMKCPGSKCWFLPYAKEFLGDWHPKLIVEPFFGSGVLGLTLLSQGYADKLVLAELDDRRIAFWKRVFDPDFASVVEEWAAKALALTLDEQRQFVLESLEEFKRSDPGMWAIIILHGFVILLWASFYRLQCFPSWELAFYFSASSYATVGYGDVILPGMWRLLGPLESMAGVLMCGVSVCLLFATITRLVYRDPRHSRKLDHAGRPVALGHSPNSSEQNYA